MLCRGDSRSARIGTLDEVLAVVIWIDSGQVSLALVYVKFLSIFEAPLSLKSFLTLVNMCVLLSEAFRLCLASVSYRGVLLYGRILHGFVRILKNSMWCILTSAVL